MCTNFEHEPKVLLLIAVEQRKDLIMRIPFHKYFLSFFICFAMGFLTISVDAAVDNTKFILSDISLLAQLGQREYFAGNVLFSRK
jgi:hypothetical protein